MATRRPQYAGTIPTIAKAYENDPRTKLAQAATALGTSTDPLVAGNWAIPQGLARVAQAITGALIEKGQQKKYAAREQEYLDAMRGALPTDAPAAAPAPADPMAAAAAALSPVGPPPVSAAPEVPSGVPAPVPASPGPMQSPPPAPASGPPPAPPMAPATNGPGAMPAPPTPYAAPPVMGPGEASPGSGITVPTMETVPALQQAPAVAPVAPTIPKAPTSASMAYARKLIESGNPDLAVLGETFLAKGMEETTSIARDTNNQQFQQGQTGYTAALTDYGNARQTDRTAAVEERAGAIERNFKRYDTYTSQRFDAAQRDKSRALERELAALRERGDWGRLKYSSRVQMMLKKQERNVYYDTPSGLAARVKANAAVDANEILKSKVDQFLGLNERVSTGGVSGRVPFRGDFDSDYATMDSLSKEITIEKLGGLGVAISDGDRQFVQDAGLGMTKPNASNKMVGEILKAALDRKSERELAFGDAQADRVSMRTFAREWKRYASEEPIVRRDKNGTPYIQTDAPSFQEWQEAQRKPVVR